MARTTKRKATDNASPQTPKRTKTNPSTARPSKARAGKARGPHAQDDNEDDVEGEGETITVSKPKSKVSSGKAGKWELQGDETERAKVGEQQDDLLIITARKLDSDETKPYQKYKPGDINWNSKEDVAKLNKWRREVFRERLHLPLLVEKDSWTDYEVAFLVLFYEKLCEAERENEDIKMPHNKATTDAFNQFFDDRNNPNDRKGPREEGTISSRIRRQTPNNRHLRKLWENLKEYKTRYDADEAYMPTITEAEFEDCVRRVKNMTKSGSVQSPDSKSSKSPTRPETGVITKPPETEVTPTPDAEMERMRAEHWIIPEFPENNTTALERNRAQANVGSFDDSWISQAKQDLNMRLRINQLEIDGWDTRSDNRWHWYSDQPQKRAAEEENKNKKKRKEDETHPDKDALSALSTANINGLLGAAIIPPVGYRGSLSDLVKKQHLPASELLVAESSEEARRVVNDSHEEAYNRYKSREEKGTEASEEVNDSPEQMEE